VSRDFLGDSRSSIFDAGRGIQLNLDSLKVLPGTTSGANFKRRSADLDGMDGQEWAVLI